MPGIDGMSVEQLDAVRGEHSWESMSEIDVAGEGYVAGRVVVTWVSICLVIRDAKNNVWSGCVCYASRVLGR
jgi:hypothetical protein